jgi:hypothetical protein
MENPAVPGDEPLVERRAETFGEEAAPLVRSGIPEVEDAVEPAGPMGQRLIQVVRMVRRRQDEDPFELMETVEPVEKMAQPEVVLEQRVEILEAQDRGSIARGLVERVVDFAPVGEVGDLAREEGLRPVGSDQPQRAGLAVARRARQEQPAPMGDPHPAERVHVVEEEDDTPAGRLP